MGRKSIVRKMRKLEEMESELITARKQCESVKKGLRKLEEEERKMKLIEAGKVIEEAGLLDSYDEEELFFLLRQHRHEICKER